MNFQYHLPVNLIFGAGKLEELGKETAKHGKKALLVTGTNSTKATGVLDRSKKILENSGVEVVIYDRVTQNPVSTLAYEGRDLAIKEKCDVVVGLGGGSIMDCAKAIAFLVYNEGDVFDYIFGIKNGDRSLPLILVPTTCGTGSEGNCFAVLTNPENQDKKSLRNMASIAKASIIDPELMLTMPLRLLATVGYDALCHNMEAFLSLNTQPMVEMQALYAIQQIVSTLPQLYEGSKDLEAFSKLSFASTLGGMVINMAGVIAPHGMEHPASGLKDIVHGNGLAALSPVIYRETLDASPEKFAEMAKIFGGKTTNDFPVYYEEFMKRLDLQTGLGKQGIKKEDIPWMSENCMKVSIAAMNAHPKKFTLDEMKELYYKAL